MSRAVNLTLSEAVMAEQCMKLGVSISAIEALPSGGCHLVCTTSAGADEIRLRFQDQIITGIVKRFPFYNARGPW